MLAIPGCVRRKAATRAGEAFRPSRLLTMADALDASLGLASFPAPSLTTTCAHKPSSLSYNSVVLP